MVSDFKEVLKIERIFMVVFIKEWNKFMVNNSLLSDVMFVV